MRMTREVAASCNAPRPHGRRVNNRRDAPGAASIDDACSRVTTLLGILRSSNSLEHRWGIIAKDCQKFLGFFEEVGCHHPSFIPQQEHLLEAQAIYADNDTKKKGFAFIHCWLKVRHCPKFIALQPSKKPRTSNSVSFDINDGEDDGNGIHDSNEKSACSSKDDIL
ncbi:hypothetical protein GUJ93_ZPchr0013g36112 [Zizania palustris]|uniref:Uncharacterized protein n=1 Tax=Zizania palustris TaxID=103762 RepID=A0A8J5X4R7_ZIZPA|nr:hypothetical protein GUJ93_ZPchr0013g36112 [Zizania palustris]